MSDPRYKPPDEESDLPTPLDRAILRWKYLKGGLDFIFALAPYFIPAAIAYYFFRDGFSRSVNYSAAIASIAFAGFLATWLFASIRLAILKRRKKCLHFDQFFASPQTDGQKPLRTEYDHEATNRRN